MPADFFSFYAMQKILGTAFIALLLASCNQNDVAETETKAEPANPQNAAATYRSPLDSITDIIEEEGKSAELLTDRANLYLIYQNVDAARNDINEAMLLDSGLAELHEVKGEMHFMLNQSRRSKKEWEKCLKLDPKNSVCIMRLAELMIAVGNYDRALELVNQQIEMDNTDAQAYFMKGIIVRDKGQDTALALQYFQNAIDLRQDYIEAIDMMAVTLAERQDTLAKFYYDRLLDLQPNNADTYFKLGVYYQNLNELNRAIESYTQATQLNRRHAESYFNLGYLHVELDLHQQARDYFTKVIENKERPYQAYYARGYTFEVVGDVLNARKDYRKALEILPMYKPAQEALARVNRLINMDEEEISGGS